MRATKATLIVACILALEGCAATFPVTINHQFVSQDFPLPIAGTRLAALQTLKRMGTKVNKDERSEDGWTILAEAGVQKIDIRFEALNDNNVRMRVAVSRFNFIKDLATSNDIINLTTVELSRLTFRRIQTATAQILLGELGYDAYKPDGILGRKTRKAILRFQRKIGTQADGKVSARLITMLRKQKAANDRVAPFSVPGDRVKGIY